MNLFIFGAGYSARHFARHHRNGFVRISGTVRSEEKFAALRSDGIEPLKFVAGSFSPDLIAVLQETDDLIVSIAPGAGGDPVLETFHAALETMPLLKRIVYLSTIGVYGDYGGAWIDETAQLNPTSERSVLRLEAENEWTKLAQKRGCDLHILRLAGIYGPGRNAIENLKAGKAKRIIKPGQIFNRIHVADIGRAIHACLARPATGEIRIWNITDDEPAPPQDVVCFAAGLLAMPPPPEVAFEEAQMSPMARSFYGENKRVSNHAMRHELGVELAFPTYREGMRALEHDHFKLKHIRSS